MLTSNALHCRHAVHGFAVLGSTACCPPPAAALPCWKVAVGLICRPS